MQNQTISYASAIQQNTKLLKQLGNSENPAQSSQHYVVAMAAQFKMHQGLRGVQFTQSQLDELTRTQNPKTIQQATQIIAQNLVDLPDHLRAQAVFNGASQALGTAPTQTVQVKPPNVLDQIKPAVVNFISNHDGLFNCPLISHKLRRDIIKTYGIYFANQEETIGYQKAAKDKSKPLNPYMV
jgi:hypothetical protein